MKAIVTGGAAVYVARSFVPEAGLPEGLARGIEIQRGLPSAWRESGE